MFSIRFGVVRVIELCFGLVQQVVENVHDGRAVTPVGCRPSNTVHGTSTSKPPMFGLTSSLRFDHVEALPSRCRACCTQGSSFRLTRVELSLRAVELIVDTTSMNSICGLSTGLVADCFCVTTCSITSSLDCRSCTRSPTSFRRHLRTLLHR